MGHSQLVRASLAHITSHGPLFHPYMELGEGQKGKKHEKRFPELSEQWRVHSAGDCGGERQRDDRVIDTEAVLMGMLGPHIDSLFLLQILTYSSLFASTRQIV